MMDSISVSKTRNMSSASMRDELSVLSHRSFDSASSGRGYTKSPSKSLKKKLKMFNPVRQKHKHKIKSDSTRSLFSSLNRKKYNQTVKTEKDISDKSISEKEYMDIPNTVVCIASSTRSQQDPLELSESSLIFDANIRYKMSLIQMKSTHPEGLTLAKENLLKCLAARDELCGKSCLQSVEVLDKLAELLSPKRLKRLDVSLSRIKEGRGDLRKLMRENSSMIQERLQFLESALSIVVRHPTGVSLTTRASLYVQRAETFILLEEPNSAFDDLICALNLNQTIKDKDKIRVVGHLFVQLGQLYFRQNETVAAIQSLAVALDLTDKGCLSSADEATALFVLGLLNENEGEYKNACRYYSRALNALNGIQAVIVPQRVPILQHLGDSRFKLEDYEASYEAYRQALYLAADQIRQDIDQNTDSERISLCLERLMSIAYCVENLLRQQNKFDLIGDFFEKILDFASQQFLSKHIELTSPLLGRLIGIYTELCTKAISDKKSSQATKYCDLATKAFKIEVKRCEANHEKTKLVILLKTLGDYLFEEHALDKAEFYFEEAIDTIICTNRDASGVEYHDASLKKRFDACLDELQRDDLDDMGDSFTLSDLLAIISQLVSMLARSLI